MKSEFGKGLTYCLGMFIAHEHWIRKLREIEQKCQGELFEGVFPRMWFDGAADHLYGLYIPESLPEEIKHDLETLRKRSIHLKCARSEGKVEWDTVHWALDYARKILRDIDEYLGAETEKGEWQ